MFGVKDKRARKEEKQYELLLDNQVDFVKSDLLSGLMEKKLLKKEKRDKKKKRERKQRKHSDASEASDDSSMSEERIEELESNLTPLERERLATK